MDGIATERARRLDTIWCIPDSLWATLEKLLSVYDPPKKTGRPRIDARRSLDGLIYRARTGCQWNQLPAAFGNDASIHRTMQRWESLSTFFGRSLSRSARNSEGWIGGGKRQTVAWARRGGCLKRGRPGR